MIFNMNWVLVTLGVLLKIKLYYCNTRTAPSISYCVTSNHLPVCGFPEDERIVSNGTFDFGKNGSATISRFDVSRLAFHEIILICKAPYPIKWLAQKPIQTTSKLVRNFDMVRVPSGKNRTRDEFEFSLQLPIDMCAHLVAISGRWRCESYENPDVAADVYLDLKDDAFQLPSNNNGSGEGDKIYFSVKQDIPFILPCNYRSDNLLNYYDKPTLFHVCDKNESEYNVSNSDYDPKIGFRLNPTPEFECFYRCCFKGGCNEFHPLNWDTRERAHLAIKTISHNSVSTIIECKSDEELLGRLIIANCKSIVDCGLKFHSVFPEIYLDPEIYRSFYPENDFVLSDPKDNLLRNISLKLSYPQGFVACSSNYTSTYLFEEKFVYEFDYFFTGLDNRRYLLSQYLPPESVISISVKLEKKSGNKVHEFFVACTISTFVLQPDVYFQIYFSNGTSLLIKCTEVGNPLNAELHQPRTSEATSIWEMRLKLSPDLKSVTCLSPWFNSTQNLAKASRKFPNIDNLTKDAETEQLFFTESMIIAISIAALFISVILIVLGCICWNYRVAMKSIYTLTREDINAFYDGKSELIYSQNSSDFECTDPFPFPPKLKISEADLILSNTLLGEGEYGLVWKGQYEGRIVAVKSTKANADLDYFRAFLQEIKVMAYIAEDPHENILPFFGAFVDKIRENVCLAVTEFSPIGNLLDYLRSNHHRDSIPIASLGTAGDSIPMEETALVNLLISFTKQIALGMEFLASKKIIHGDLAARNILVFEQNVVKITDFGLSRKLYSYTNYMKSPQTQLPWRWMATESLRFFKFSSESDVWSFGVTLWEIFSLGEVPFAGLNYTSDFVEKLEMGLRLSKPLKATEFVFELMEKCWETYPKKRPKFSECRAHFL